MSDTTAVTYNIRRNDGTPDVGATVTARLNRTEIVVGEGYVMPYEVVSHPDENGDGVLHLVPNEGGSTESAYIVVIEGTDKTEKLTTVVPNVTTIALEACSTLPPYPGKTDAQANVEAAVNAGTTATEQANIATTQAGIATTQAGTATTQAGIATTKAGEAAGSAAAALTAKGDAQSFSSSASGYSESAANAAAAAAQSRDDAGVHATNALNAKAAAEAARDTAITKAGEAAGSATTATNQAGTATTQAGIATTKAGEASASATTASTQAGIATTKAGEAATSAGTASTQAGIATQRANEAGQASSDASTAAGVATGKAQIATDKSALAAQSASDAQAARDIAVTKAGEAAGSATTATQQATISTNKAGEAAASATTATQQATLSTNKAAESTSSAQTASGVLASAQFIYGSIGSISAALAIMLGYANTGTAQASLAQQYAAQAASVVQQDLSGVTAQALHRSPNNTVATFIYNTMKDSDGGAWREKCDHLSYTNEALNGPWIATVDASGYQTELAARCMGGTLGSELLPNATDATQWSGNSATPTSVGGALRVLTTAGFGNASRAIATTPGQLYILRARRVTDSSANGNTFQATMIAGNTPGSSTLLNTTIAANKGQSGIATFVATAATTYVGLGVNTGAAGNSVDFDSISLKSVTAFAPSSSYYPNATDGKFYRLWKNLLKESEFRNGTADANNGVTSLVTASTLTGFSGALAFGYDGATNQSAGKQFNAFTGSATFSVIVKMDDGAAPTLTGTTAGPGASFAFIVAGSIVAPNTYTVTDMSATYGAGFYRVSCSASGLSNLTTFTLIKHAIADNRTFKTTAWQMEYGTAVSAYEAKTVDLSQTEVFRGNTAKFPRLAAIVIEGQRWIIYALDQPGRPMWMVFGTTNLTENGGLSGVAAREGIIAICSASNTAPLGIFNFAKDDIRLGTNATYVANGALKYRQIKDRMLSTGGAFNTKGTLTFAGMDGYSLGPIANGIAMTTMPDAPVDPVTGLQVPTIALATNGGLSVIQNTGTVVNSASTSSRNYVILNQYMVASYDTAFTAFQYALSPSKLGSSFAELALTGTSAGGFMSPNNTGRQALGGRGTVGRITTGTQMNLLRLNEMAGTSSLVATITPTFNTGWMAGDIRRTVLCDTTPGTINSTDLIADTGFDNTGAWSAGDAQWVVSGSAANYTTAAGVHYLAPVAGVAVTSGEVYTATFTVSGIGSGTAYLGLYDQAGSGGYVANGLIAQSGPGASMSGAYMTFTANGTYTVTFRAAATGTGLRLYSSTSGVNFSLTDFSLKLQVADRSYKGRWLTPNGTLAKTLVATAAQAVAYGSFSNSNYLQEAYSADLDPGTTGVYVSIIGSIPTGVAAAGWAMDRSAATGAYYRLGHSATGQIVAEVNDGTTTRTATTTATYNTGSLLKIEMSYATSGTLTIKVNGVQVQQTTGNPLLTLTNASAVFTVGNRRALDAAWAGSLAFVKVGMTIPSDDASAWMWEQEKEMLRDGAKVTLPSSNALVGIDYDPQEDKWKTVDAANEATFVGLVRTATATVSAGSFTGCSHTSGIKLLARSTTNPGVDLTMASWNLREELMRRAEEMARIQTPLAPLDFMGTFTANTVNGSALITVTGSSLVIPAGCTLVGARVTGTGIPANTTVLAVNGTQVQLSAACTALGSGVTVNILDLILPVGQSPHIVSSAGATQREGSGFAWTRGFDGIRERVSYISAPGAQWLQVEPRRMAA